MNRALIVLFICCTHFLPLLPNSFVLNAQSLQSGNILIEFYEDLGRFVPYYISEDVEPDSFHKHKVPLLFDLDPKTTALGVLIDNRYVVPADSRSFSQELIVNDGTVTFLWKSDSFEVEQKISLLLSQKASRLQLHSGYAVTTTITNISRRNHDVGIHHLLDTVLGEEKEAHFLTDQSVPIKAEKGFSYSLPDYWVSPASIGPYMGFQGMVKGYGLDSPDKIVFANWRRLHNSHWNIYVRQYRSFNYLPFSINDSGVSYFYSPKTLSPGDSYSTVLAFGLYDNSSYSLLEVTPVEPQASPVSTPYDDETTPDSDDDDDLFEQFIKLQQQINQYLREPEGIDSERIEELRQELKRIERSLLEEEN